MQEGKRQEPDLGTGCIRALVEKVFRDFLFLFQDFRHHAHDITANTNVIKLSHCAFTSASCSADSKPSSVDLRM